MEKRTENLSHCKAISLIFICDTHLGCLESFMLSFSPFKRLREDSLRFHLCACLYVCVCCCGDRECKAQPHWEHRKWWVQLLGCSHQSPDNMASAIGVQLPQPYYKRVLNSTMTRAELESGSFAIGNVS